MPIRDLICGREQQWSIQAFLNEVGFPLLVQVKGNQAIYAVGSVCRLSGKRNC